ncbi:MAG: bifunctional transcriptional activator/DNA repair enzyme AdaA [Alphaproteobacteria bacterium]
MSNETYTTIERALRHIAAHQTEQPSLAELAAEAGLSESHFQRVFKSWAGVSPKQFLKHLTLQAAKERLKQSESLLDAAYDVGLSGPGRLHDLFVTLEAMTPGDFKRAGQGVDIHYGFHDSPFGECLLAVTDRGICGLGFVGEGGRIAALEDFRRRWPAARFIERSCETASLMPEIFATGANVPAGRLALAVPGTPFQLKVWQGLLNIPSGRLSTYGALAQRLGMPKGAARAVGSAVGANPVSWLIPCHRVIRETGAVTGYHWGTGRKLAMLGWEAEKLGRERPRVRTY